MSEWITDRRPTGADADGWGRVWNSKGQSVLYGDVAHWEPWMPIVPPAPYVKPRRWTVRYHDNYRIWVIYDCQGSVFHVPLNGLNYNNDEHRQAAEEIANIYERTLP